MGELASNGVVATVFAKLHCLKFFRNWIKRWWVYIAKANAWISIAQLMTLYGCADNVVRRSMQAAVTWEALKSRHMLDDRLAIAICRSAVTSAIRKIQVVHDGDSGMIVSQPRIVTPVVPDMFNDYKTGAYGHGDIRRPESIAWRQPQGGGYFSDPGCHAVFKFQQKGPAWIVQGLLGKPGVRGDGHPLSNFDSNARSPTTDPAPLTLASVSKVLRLSCPGGLLEIEDSLLLCNRSPENGAGHGHLVCLTNAFPNAGTPPAKVTSGQFVSVISLRVSPQAIALVPHCIAQSAISQERRARGVGEGEEFPDMRRMVAYTGMQRKEIFVATLTRTPMTYNVANVSAPQRVYAFTGIMDIISVKDPELRIPRGIVGFSYQVRVTRDSGAFRAGVLVVDAGGSRAEDGAIFWLKWGADATGCVIQGTDGARYAKWTLQEVDRGRELGNPYDIVYYGNEQRPGVFLVTDNQGHQVRYFRFDLAISHDIIRHDVQLSGRLIGSGTPALRGGTANDAGLCQCAGIATFGDSILVCCMGGRTHGMILQVDNAEGIAEYLDMARQFHEYAGIVDGGCKDDAYPTRKKEILEYTLTDMMAGWQVVVDYLRQHLQERKTAIDMAEAGLNGVYGALPGKTVKGIIETGFTSLKRVHDDIERLVGTSVDNRNACLMHNIKAAAIGSEREMEGNVMGGTANATSSTRTSNTALTCYEWGCVRSNKVLETVKQCTDVGYIPFKGGNGTYEYAHRLVEGRSRATVPYGRVVQPLVKRAEIRAHKATHLKWVERGMTPPQRADARERRLGVIRVANTFRGLVGRKERKEVPTDKWKKYTGEPKYSFHGTHLASEDATVDLDAIFNGEIVIDAEPEADVTVLEARMRNGGIWQSFDVDDIIVMVPPDESRDPYFLGVIAKQKTFDEQSDPSKETVCFHYLEREVGKGLVFDVSVEPEGPEYYRDEFSTKRPEVIYLYQLVTDMNDEYIILTPPWKRRATAVKGASGRTRQVTADVTSITWQCHRELIALIHNTRSLNQELERRERASRLLMNVEEGGSEESEGEGEPPLDRGVKRHSTVATGRSTNLGGTSLRSSRHVVPGRDIEQNEEQDDGGMTEADEFPAAMAIRCASRTRRGSHAILESSDED